MSNYLTIFKTLWKLMPLLLVIAIGILLYTYRNERQKVATFKEFNRVQAAEIKTWKDKAGYHRTRAEVAEIDAKHARLVLNTKLQQHLKKEVGNIKRNLISYTKVKASTQGSFITKAKDTVYITDTITSLPAKEFSIHTADLDFKGSYIPEQDTLLVDYKITHNFELFYYYKRPGTSPWNLFRKKRAVAEIKFLNQHSKTDSLFTIILKRKKSFWRRLFSH